MALLESGRVYDISLPGYNEDTPIKTILQDFMTEYAEVTGITDSKYTDLYYGNPDYEDPYTEGFFYLPYISLGPWTQKSLQLIFVFPYSSPGVTASTTTIAQICFDDSMYEYYSTPISNIGYACAYKIKNQNTYYYNYGNSLTIDFTKNFYFRYDTRFLSSHHFYTINCFNYDKDSELDELYYSPLIFIYNNSDVLFDSYNNGGTYDQVLVFNNLGEIGRISGEYKTEILSDSYKFIHNNYNFIPQLYTNQDDSIILQRSSMGRSKAFNDEGKGGCDNIYITNPSKYNKLESLVDYQKMAEYKDCWLKGKLYTDNKKFIMGVGSLKKFNYANPYENGELTTPYIPVIEGDSIPNAPIKPPVPEEPKLVSWSTGTDK